MKHVYLELSSHNWLYIYLYIYSNIFSFQVEIPTRSEFKRTSCSLSLKMS